MSTRKAAQPAGARTAKKKAVPKSQTAAAKTASKPGVRTLITGQAGATQFDPAFYADAAVLNGIDPDTAPFSDEQAAEIAEVLLRRIAAELKDINTLLNT
jgi:hypothetical protein